MQAFWTSFISRVLTHKCADNAKVWNKTTRLTLTLTMFNISVVKKNHAAKEGSDTRQYEGHHKDCMLHNHCVFLLTMVYFETLRCFSKTKLCKKQVGKVSCKVGCQSNNFSNYLFKDIAWTQAHSKTGQEEVTTQHYQWVETHHTFTAWDFCSVRCFSYCIWPTLIFRLESLAINDW